MNGQSGCVSFKSGTTVLGCTLCRTPGITQGVLGHDEIDKTEVLICARCWRALVGMFPGVACERCHALEFDPTYERGVLHGYQTAMRRARKGGAEDPSPRRNPRIAAMARRVERLTQAAMRHVLSHRGGNIPRAGDE